MDQLRDQVKTYADENEKLKREIDSLCFGDGKEREALQDKIDTLKLVMNDYSLMKEVQELKKKDFVPQEGPAYKALKEEVNKLKEPDFNY